MAVVKNQLMGIDASMASPPQLTVTSVARMVVLIDSLEPARLLST